MQGLEESGEINVILGTSVDHPAWYTVNVGTMMAWHRAKLPGREGSWPLQSKARIPVMDWFAPFRFSWPGDMCITSVEASTVILGRESIA
jgi:hypothetical protein